MAMLETLYVLNELFHWLCSFAAKLKLVNAGALSDLEQLTEIVPYYETQEILSVLKDEPKEDWEASITAKFKHHLAKVVEQCHYRIYDGHMFNAI